MSWPGWPVMFSVPLLTFMNAASSRTTVCQRERSSAVPSNSSLPGHDSIGAVTAIWICTVRERTPSLTLNVAVYSPGSVYVWLALAVVASTVPSDVKSHA